MSDHTLESLIGDDLPMVIDRYIGNRELEIAVDGEVFLGDDKIDSDLRYSMNNCYGYMKSRAFEDAMQRARPIAEAEYKKIAKTVPMGSTITMYRWKFFKNAKDGALVSEMRSDY